MNVGAGFMNLFPYGNKRFPNQNMHNGLQRGMANPFMQVKNSSRKPSDFFGSNNLNNQGQYVSNIVSDSMSYANSLSTARLNKKNTALQIKKLKYDFKAISTQIMRSKTSFSAKQAASKARREVIRLKCQRQSGNYEDEEIQSAIAHAQAMERVAKKKARHLEEEEMVKVTGGPCQCELEEKDLEERDNALEREILEEESRQQDDAMYDVTQDVNEQMQEAAQEINKQMQEAAREINEQMQEAARDINEQMYEMTQDEFCEMTQEQMYEIMQQLQEQMQEQFQDDLFDSMELTIQQEMDPADYKMMKIKHRSEEMKAIAKADGEYLKAMFEKYQMDRTSASAGAINSSASFGVSSSNVGMEGFTGGFTGGFDISI